MSNTFTQFHHQYVFAPKYRAAVIQPEWEVELYKYITGIVQNNKHKMLCINGMPDHLHLLIGFHTTQSSADFMQDVKSGSSKWINDKKLTKSRFEWQGGYGGFSYAKSQVPNLIKYIQNQKQHHQKESFLTEYRNLLTEFEIEYKEEYLFKELI
jgi:putative transposase